MVAAPHMALLWPLVRGDLARTTAAGQYTLRVTMGGVTENLTFPAVALTDERYYWFAGDAQADADGGVGGVGDLAALLRSTLLTHSQAVTVTVTTSATNRLTIDTGLVLTAILWSHASTTLSAVPFGWAQTDTTTAGVHAAPNQTRGAWCPVQPASYDSRDLAEFMGAVARAESGAQRVAVWGEKRAPRELRWDLLLPRYARRDYADATEPTGTLEDVWRYAFMRGLPVRVYRDASSRTSSSYGGPYLADADDYPWRLQQLVDRAGPGARITRFRARVKLRRVAA